MPTEQFKRSNKRTKLKLSNKDEKNLFGDFKEDKKGVVFTVDDVLFTGQYRKSFYELTKEDDKKREYSASYDYVDGKLYDIDIRRGKTSAETDDGRASVGVRIDKSDEYSIHNHPAHNHPSDNWNRASGSDISNLLINQVLRDDYSLKASFIMQPDGRLIRYRVFNPEKAKSKIQDINDALAKLDFKERAKILKNHGAIDHEIEDRVENIRLNEYLIANKKLIQSKKSVDNQKKVEDRYKKITQPYHTRIDVIYDKITALEYKRSKIEYGYHNYDDKRQKRINKQTKEIDIKISELNQDLLEIDAKLIDIYDAEATSRNKFYKLVKNKKYIDVDKITERKNNLMLERRIYNKYVEYMKYEFGIEIKRMPKNFKIPLTLG